MKDQDRIRYLIDRYVAGTCTRRELDELLDEVRRQPEESMLQDLLPDVGGYEDVASDDGPEWEDLQRRIRRVRPATRTGWWAAAACFLVLIIAYAGFRWWDAGHEAEYAHRVDSPAAVESTVETGGEEHRLLVLPDGSKVWLGSNTRMELAKGFNTNTREVALFGEAFFDISKDEHRPFVIQTGSIRTTVLGTAFNIRAFPGEEEVVVTVARGKVSVQDENKKPSTLTANQQIRLNVEAEKSETVPVDAAAVTEWIKEDLVLQKVTLAEVQGILEERYGVSIVFDDPRLKHCRFTATFFKNAGIDEVMSAICMVNNATFERRDDVITILGDGCPDDIRE